MDTGSGLDDTDISSDSPTEWGIGTAHSPGRFPVIKSQRFFNCRDNFYILISEAGSVGVFWHLFNLYSFEFLLLHCR